MKILALDLSSPRGSLALRGIQEVAAHDDGLAAGRTDLGGHWLDGGRVAAD